MPQWDFLDFLAQQARKLPRFRLLMETEATGLVEAAGNVVGVHGTSADGALEVRAELTVAADGRHSVLREQAGLEAFRAGIVAVAPHLRERVGELHGWDDIKLLTVQVNRLRRWHRPGFLCIGDGELAAMQRRRGFPTRMTQRLQLFLQRNVIGRVLSSGATPGIAWPIRLMQRFPVLRRIPARLIGIGFRPEHVRPARI